MSITLTIDLPDELAERLASWSEEERRRFSAHAISDALSFRQEEEGDCETVVQQALDDMNAGVGLISFEDFCRRWDAVRASAGATESR